MLVASLFSGDSGRAWGDSTNFITRSGDKLMDGMSEYRFIGTNAPFLGRSWADPTEIEDEIRAANRSGINVIRLYPFEVKMASDLPGHLPSCDGTRMLQRKCLHAI